jgi:uncharacterized protein GlcG (DUF336 family)
MLNLTLEQAQRIITGGIKQAQTMNIKLCFSVVDARGDLIASARMDGARWMTADISRGKAMVSATYGQPSAALEAQKDSAPNQSMLLMTQGKFVYRQGAVPIIVNGEVIGAVGASGAAPGQDEDCAKAGAAAL